MRKLNLRLLSVNGNYQDFQKRLNYLKNRNEAQIKPRAGIEPATSSLPRKRDTAMPPRRTYSDYMLADICYQINLPAFRRSEPVNPAATSKFMKSCIIS